MFEPLISVIVPVYNVEKYIAECLNSLLVQKYSNIEILVVNDGSTDNSRNIIEKYLNKFRKIKILEKTNGGLSDARNYGLQYCNGEYICFIDGDDWVEPYLFELVVGILKNKLIDIIMFEYYKTHNEIKKNISFPIKGGYINSKEVIKEIVLPLYGTTSGEYLNNYDIFYSSVCNKIYRKEILIGKRFVSERIIYSEDLIFNLEVLKDVNNMYIINKPLYNYRYNPQSLTHKYRKDYLKMKLKMFEEMEKISHIYNDKSIIIRMNRKKFYQSLFCAINACKDNSTSKKHKIDSINEIVNSSLVEDGIKLVKLNEVPINLRAFYWMIMKKKTNLLYFSICTYQKIKRLK